MKMQIIHFRIIPDDLLEIGCVAHEIVIPNVHTATSVEPSYSA